MSRCTAPVYGHRTPSGAANCPVCSKRSRSYRTHSNYYDSYIPTRSSTRSKGGNYSSSSGRTIKPKWSNPESFLYYTPAEVKTLTPIRENVEQRSKENDLRDVFLCHAWDDRKNAAKELHDLLELNGVSVWFSEKDVLLGSSLLREIDKGLAKSKIGIVLVTPNFLDRIQNEGIADKELSALLARDLLVPIVYNTTFEKLRDVSPLLGSRSGLNANEESMQNISAKLAELICLS